MVTRQEWATAYHEAGHAVVARFVGLAPQTISIEPEDDAHGHVEYGELPEWYDPDDRNDERLRWFVEQHMQSALGGPLAERRFRGRNNRVGAAHDYEKVRFLAGLVCGSPEEIDAFTEWLRIRTTALIDNVLLWEQITLVTEALIERRTLAADEFNEVLGRWSLGLPEQ